MLSSALAICVAVKQWRRRTVNGFVISLTLVSIPSDRVLLAQTTTVVSRSQLCPTPTYKYLRADEDYSYLRDRACRTDPFDGIKYIPLRSDPEWFVSLGGEVRENVEYFSNPRWGQQPQGSAYALQRFMFHSDVHLGERWRIFTQLKSGLENNREGGARVIDEDKLDINQAFLDATLLSTGKNAVTLRLGRQELAFGSRRYVSAREGPNVRQTFDGVRLIVSSHAWAVSLLATKPVQTKPGFFDDAPKSGQTFWGAYASRSLAEKSGLNVDLYYLGLDSKQARFEQGVGREQRHTAGTRFWGKRDSFDEDLELTYQWGHFDDGGIQAWAVESETGYSFGSTIGKPRLALKADIASGDRNPHDNCLQTFNPLFPRGLYQQLVDLNGHVNFIDLDPTVVLHPTSSLSVIADWDFFWRESVQDGVYGVGGNLIRAGDGSRARYIGSQPSLVAEWRIQRHITAVLIYSHFATGEFLKQTGPARTVNYGSIWFDFKF
jgi:hypothetical protein